MKFEKNIMELFLYASTSVKYYGCPSAFPVLPKETGNAEGFLCENLFNFIRSIQKEQLIYLSHLTADW